MIEMDILYAWIASIASASSPLITKATSKTLIKSPWLFNILWAAFRVPFIGTIALLLGAGLPSHWGLILLLTSCYALYYIAVTTATYRLDVTVLAPMFSLVAMFGVLLGTIFLGEHIAPLGLVLIAIIILGTPFAAYNEKLRLKSFMHIDILIAVGAMALLALVGFFSHKSVAANGYATTILWQSVITAGLLLPTLRFADRSKEKITRKKLYPFIALGIAGCIYTLAVTQAYAHNLSLSSVIVSLPLSMILAFFLGKFFPQLFEKQPAKVYIIRFSAASLMVASAIWLSLLPTH